MLACAVEIDRYVGYWIDRKVYVNKVGIMDNIKIVFIWV